MKKTKTTDNHIKERAQNARPHAMWNITDWDLSDARVQMYKDFDLKRLAIGKEICPETKKEHMHVFISWIKPKRFAAMQKLLGKKCHMNAAALDDWNYCLKDGNYFIKDNSKQGTRNDLDEVRTVARDQGMREVTKHYNSQQIQTAEKYLTYNESGRNWMPKMFWLWGKTGTGKSRFARVIAPDDDYLYTKSEDSKWWDGYDRHKNVIIDDFRDDWWKISQLLSLCDRYKKKVEVKNGWRQFVPKIIVITSCYHPKDLYIGSKEKMDQLMRRFNFILEIL